MYKTKTLVEHVKRSVVDAVWDRSKLPKGVLDIEGMSSNKIRHLLNNIMDMPDVNYLEIGVWKGSTFVSSLYGNDVKSAYAIDDWSQFNGKKSKKVFESNCEAFNIVNYELFNENSFKLDLSKIKTKINVYFYDGDHFEEWSYAAIKYYYEVLADQFILIVDDYDWPMVRKGIERGISDCNLNILYENHLQSNFCGDKDTWWNGLYIALINK